jgi:hypothetical protein
VTKHDKEIDIRSHGRLLEPVLLDSDIGMDDSAYVGVTAEVVEETKGHDTKTHAGGEMPVLVADILELTRAGVDDLDI